MAIGQELRIKDILSYDGKASIFDLTGGLLGIEDQNLKTILPSVVKSSVNAVILSPGEARKHFAFFENKLGPALIIQADWSNYRWDAQSPYPAQKFRHVVISNAAECLRLGASAAIINAYFGTSDDDNAADFQMVRQLAEEGFDVGIPVLVNIVPLGSRVNPGNFDDVAVLGARMCLEIGANAVALPCLTEEKLGFAKKASLQSPIFLNCQIPPLSRSIPFNSLSQIVENQKLAGFILNGFQDIALLNKLITTLHIK